MAGEFRRTGVQEYRTGKGVRKKLAHTGALLFQRSTPQASE
jgi:hypothetical protein